jgi:hypothetical protein
MNLMASLGSAGKPKAHTLLRGFATNVANYQPLGPACNSPGALRLSDFCRQSGYPPCCRDPCGVLDEYSEGNNELNFVQLLLREAFEAMPTVKLHFVIDTGRNGVDDVRHDCSNWCNIRGAGVGHGATTATALPEVDAYFWLKSEMQLSLVSTGQ